jgi:hypothetical protein
MEPRADSASAPRTVAQRLHVNRRTLQVALGLIWVVDGLLKFQPHLFKPSFISDVVRPMAAGQPTLVGSTISHMANFLSHEATMWVAIFGLIEIAIGAGLLFSRTLKPALVASFIWGAGLYLFGEGLGMLLTGDTSPLTGAPGAVCFYVLLGVVVWPKAEEKTGRLKVGAESSATGRAVFGGTGSLLAWAAIWIFEAIIWMFPFNRTGNSITNQMAATSGGEPGWYAHFLNSFGHAFTGAGVWAAIILATASIVIALGPLVSNRPQVYIGLGIGLALAYWVTGQGLGELLTGGETDPNNGPIVALIGLSLLPLIPARANEPTPAARLLTLHPLAAVFSVLAIALVPLAVAVVPTTTEAVATPAASTPAAATASDSASSSSSSSGSSMKGMSMSPKKGSSASPMNMSAMAGLNVTGAKWKYTGPALPVAEVKALTTFSDDEEKGHVMQTPQCTAQPTSQQILGAIQYVQATSAAVARYKNLGTALADGYVPITNTLWPQSNVVSPSYTGAAISGQFAYPVAHYLNFHYMNRQDMLKPNTVDSLVYATTPYGPVLVAAMYLMPGPQKGPMPYGCLVQWHAHTNLCTSDASGEVDGIGNCGLGSHVDATTAFMTHVWQVPVAGGPLAIDPSDLQVVEAAIMAQQ